MELFLGFIIIIVSYIIIAYLFYKAWELLFDEISETLTKRMIITSIILGILWPITSLILFPVTVIVLFNDLAK